MNLRIAILAIAASALFALTGPAATQGWPCEPGTDYCPSPLQQRVDTSFSRIPITTQYSRVQRQLRPRPGQACTQASDCPWIDRHGVEHIFLGDRPSDAPLMTKIVSARDFVGRPIATLDIGLARGRRTVLHNIGLFLLGQQIDCPDGATSTGGPALCSATLNPGWIQISFDPQGQLHSVRFDGYHGV